MPVKVVFYDFDGTIVDSGSVHIAAWRAAFERFRVPVPLGFYEFQAGRGNDDSALYGLGPDRYRECGDDFIAFKERYVIEHAGEVKYFNDFDVIKDSLASTGRSVWIVTSSPQLFCTAVMGRIPALRTLREQTVWREMYTLSKPSPDSLFAGFLEAHVDARDAVYVGDTVIDYHAAERANCGFVYYLRDKVLADPGLPSNVPCISRHGDLVAILGQLGG